MLYPPGFLVLLKPGKKSLDNPTPHPGGYNKLLYPPRFLVLLKPGKKGVSLVRRVRQIVIPRGLLVLLRPGKKGVYLLGQLDPTPRRV